MVNMVDRLKYKSHIAMAGKEDSILLIIDMQDRLVNSPVFPIYERGKIVENIKALIKTANVFKLPVMVVEQKKLGETIPEIKELLHQYNMYHPIEKLCFSSYGNEEFRRRLEEINRTRVLICGVETHICVIQTALDLVENGYSTQIIKDATSSHLKTDFETAIGRVRGDGVVITTTEMLIYELLKEAGADEFKKVLEIVKDKRGR